MSTKKLVVFGSGDIGQLAHYYFTNDSAYDVVAFTVDAAYIKEATFCGVPVVPFEEVEHHYPPSEYDLFLTNDGINNKQWTLFALFKNPCNIQTNNP